MVDRREQPYLQSDMLGMRRLLERALSRREILGAKDVCDQKLIPALARLKLARTP